MSLCSLAWIWIRRPTRSDAAGARIVNRVALFDDTGIDAEENQFADELVGPEFEGEGGELLVVGGGHLDLQLLVVGVHADGGGDVERAGEVIDHGVEQILDALVFESGATGDGDQFVGDGGAADPLFEFLEETGSSIRNFSPTCSSTSATACTSS
jgi:hypothetical protein